MYFLLLVILQSTSYFLSHCMSADGGQVFPIFGATSPQIAALPIIAILALTAIKDGVEDWRRTTLDNAGEF